MKALKILLFLIILINFILLGFLFSQFSSRVIYEPEKANITRAIDGDTIDTDIGRVRLLGINTPEKKKPYYQEAKDYLKQFEGKIVTLERTKEDKDKYSRLLRYAFFQKTFINEELLRQGLANLYIYDKDEYTSRLEKAEEQARSQGLGIWKKSQDICANCIILKELNPVDPGEFVILKNSCSFPCNLENWEIKDTANHFTRLNFSLKENEEKKLDYDKIWNDAGDNFFLRDDSGLLVVFYRY